MPSVEVGIAVEYRCILLLSKIGQLIPKSMSSLLNGGGGGGDGDGDSYGFQVSTSFKGVKSTEHG